MAIVDIQHTLVRDALPVKEAEKFAAIIGADVNDLYFAEPTLADFQIATAYMPPLPPNATAEQLEERAKAEANRDAFSVMSVIKDGSGAKVMKTEHFPRLPAGIGAKLINTASGILMTIIRNGATGAADAVGKIAPAPSEEPTTPPSASST